MRLHQLLRVFRLVVELCGQLMILQDGEACLCLKLLVVESHKIGLRLLNLEVHLLRQFLDILNLLELFLVDLNHARLLFIFELLLQGCNHILHVILGGLVLLCREQPLVNALPLCSCILQLLLKVFAALSDVLGMLHFILHVFIVQVVRYLIQLLVPCLLFLVCFPVKVVSLALQGTKRGS